MKAAVFVLERHKGEILPVNTANFTGDVITVSKQLTLVFGTKNQIMWRQIKISSSSIVV